MAVGGTLLLVSWALGGALSNISNSVAQRGAGWATIGASNTKLTATDLQTVHDELAVIESLGDPFLNQLGAHKDPSHWYLLAREAADAGLVGGLGDGKLRAEEIATAVNMQSKSKGTDQPEIDGTFIVRMIMAKAHASEHTVLATLAKVNGVHRLNGLYASMPRFSDARLRVEAAKALTSASADLVVLDARQLKLPEVPEPTAAELQEHLTKYGAQKPGEGPSGFGYRLPDRVKVEWIEIPIASVRTAIEASDALNTLTLKKKFAENPAKFGVTDASLDALTLFPAYEASVRQRVLDELVTERMNEITKFTADQVALSQRGIAKDGGFLRLPDDWATRQPNMQSLCDQIAQQFKVSPPFYGSTGGAWQSAADLKAIRELGTSTTTKYGTPGLAFADLVDRAQELGRGNDTTPIQKGVVGPPMISSTKGVFFFRITDVDPSRAPATVEEAGETLKRDVIAEDRYAALKAALADIEGLAKNDGLTSVAERYQAKLDFAARIAETNPQMLGYGIKMAASLPGIGTNDDAIQAIVSHAAKLPLDKPVADLPQADRTFVFTLDDKMMVVAARITDVAPLTLEDFQATVANPRAKDGLLEGDFRTGINQLLTLDSLKKRHNFHLIREKDDKKDGKKGDGADGDAKSDSDAEKKA